MGSKVFHLLGLLMAIVLLISSEVAARDLAETSNDLNQNEKAKGTTGVYAKDISNGGPYGGGTNGGGYPGTYGSNGGYPGTYGGGGGGYPGTYGGGGGGYPGGNGGGNCPYGCCGGGYYGQGCRCCTYAEAVQANIKGQPHN